MQIINTPLGNVDITPYIHDLGELCDLLFIDIETTGFSHKTSNLYLIGCVYYKDNQFFATQFFADKYSDESELLNEFFNFAKDFKVLVHYNGNNFDIPYILGKVKEHSLDYSFDNFNGVDIYKRISPLKTFLKLENCKLKTVESFLNINRDDKFTGGDLISIYHSYVKDGNEELKKMLLLHNFEDIKGMLEILPILSYVDLFENPKKVTKVSANYYNDSDNNQKSELLMIFDIEQTLPIPISFLYDSCYFTGNKNQGMLKIPLVEGELKYFYANYEDYYYLPDEDIALHKSVGSFVDKLHREKAKASTCYTRKYGKYLPEWSDLFTPFFKSDYNSDKLFFELTDERKTDRELFSTYVTHILNHMIDY